MTSSTAANLQALYAKRATELHRAQENTAASLQRRHAAENRLQNLRALVAAIESRTAAVSRMLAQKEPLATAAESHLAEKESKTGLAGVAPDKAIKAPKQQADGSTGVTAVEDEYLRLRKLEASGEVPNGTAFKWWRANKTSPTRAAAGAGQQPGRNGPSWGERIVSGNPE